MTESVSVQGLAQPVQTCSKNPITTCLQTSSLPDQELGPYGSDSDSDSEDQDDDYENSSVEDNEIGPVTGQKRKQNIASTSKKRIKREKESPSDFDKYVFLGKWIASFLDPWIEIATVLKVGLYKSGKGHLFTSDSENDAAVHTGDKTLNIAKENDSRSESHFREICEHFPPLVGMLDRIVQSKDHSTFNDLVTAISAGIRMTTTQDFGLVRYGLLDWLTEDVGVSSSPASNKGRHGKRFKKRGRRHPLIAKLWCPRIYFKDLLDQQEQLDFNNSRNGTSLKLENSPTSIVSEIMNNKVFLSDQDYFLGLYDVHKIDLNDRWTGLLESYILIRICRALLHGKSGVFVPKKETRGRPSKAKQHKITEVTPRIIAYVCLQFRFATSNVKSWDERDEDIGYNFKTFYEIILDIFASPSERSKALLRFWNQQVFGAPEPRPVIKTESIKFIMVEWDPKSRKGYNQPRDRDIFQQEMHNTRASSVGGRKSVPDWPSVSHAGHTEDTILQRTMVPPAHYPDRRSTPAWSSSDNSPTAILQPITTLLSHNLSGVHSPTVNKSDPQQPVQVPVQEQEPSPPESSPLVAEERTLVNQSPEKDSDEPLSALYVHAHIHGQFSHLL